MIIIIRSFLVNLLGLTGTVHLFRKFRGKLNSLLAIDKYWSYFEKTTVAGEKAYFSIRIRAQRVKKSLSKKLPGNFLEK